MEKGSGQSPPTTQSVESTCADCGLTFEYAASLHQCQEGKRRLAGPWLDEIQEKQGGVIWKEDRRG